MTGNSSKHCIVIGGGVVGLTTAWSLAERGHTVTLIERESQVGQGASRANGGQLSYRYVAPLADAGVPLKALGWLLDRDGPLRFRPEANWRQWSWLLAFLRACRGPVNRATTARLLELGAFSQTSFARLLRRAKLDADDIALRAPGKLVVYRRGDEFARAAARMPSPAVERALSPDECLALEPALREGSERLAGGLFTPGEAVADCHRFCSALAARLRQHGNFDGLVNAHARGFVVRGDAVVGVRTSVGEIAADAVVLAAGLQSRDLAADVGVALPLYPLKGYSLTAAIGPAHRPPEVSVTDFEKKILYARIGAQLRIAAMVDLVGEDLTLDPGRIASLRRSVRALLPQAADYDAAEPWAGLRPATPDGLPIIGACRLRNLWLNVGHGALGFTFSSGTAEIVADLVDGRVSPAVDAIMRDLPGEPRS